LKDSAFRKALHGVVSDGYVISVERDHERNIQEFGDWEGGSAPESEVRMDELDLSGAEPRMEDRSDRVLPVNLAPNMPETRRRGGKQKRLGGKLQR
jgi:hypothetical protein